MNLGSEPARSSSPRLRCVLIVAMMTGLAAGCGSDTAPEPGQDGKADGAAAGAEAGARRSNVDAVLEGVTGRQAVRQYRQAKESLDRIRDERARDFGDAMGE